MLGSRVAVLSADTPAQAICKAFPTPPAGARRELIGGFVQKLVSAGVWAKLDCLYVFAAADAQAACVDWKKPTRSATQVNSPTFTADRGFAGNGTTSYLDNGVNFSTLGGRYSQNDACGFSWSLTNAQGNANFDSGFPSINSRNTAGPGLRVVANGMDLTTTVADSLGLSAFSRVSASLTYVYRNGTNLNSSATASSAPSNSQYLTGRSGSSFGTRQVAINGAGGALSDAEQAALFSAAYDYLHALGAV